MGRALAWMALVLVFALVPSCGESPEDCSNGTCACEDGESCDFECKAPPCNVSCAGDNASCTGACANGNCSCASNSHCDFTCQSPPCHVDCAAGTTCTGTCANGDCNCGPGSSCTFQCQSGPCHVNCQGQNATCNGVCANGTCTCGAGSTCHFGCLDSNCHVNCQSATSCILDCPSGNAGKQGCSIDSCSAGAAVICPNGKATTCGAACPP